MRILFLYGKDPTVLLQKYKQGEVPANFLYGLPLFSNEGISADAFCPFQNRFLSWLQSLVTRKVSQNLGGYIKLLRLPLIIRHYDGVVVVNHDVVIAAAIIRALVAPKTKLFFIDDRAESVAKDRPLQRALIRRYDWLIPYSQNQLRLTKAIFHDRATVAYWGSDCAFFKPGDADGSDTFVFSVGGDAGRDFQTFLAAAEKLSYISFVLVGRQSQLKGCVIPRNVTVHYSMDIREVREYYRRARMVVIPLYADGSELASGKEASLTSGVTSLGDCICLGKPVIISRMEWVGEYIEPGIHAEVVPCGDPELLARAIQRVYSDDAYRKSLGAHLARLRNRFTIAHWVRTVSTLITST